MILRRSLLAGLTGLGACGPNLAKRFNGYCFVANRGSHTLAVVNLTRFKVEKQIILTGAPAAVMSTPNGKTVLALLPDVGSVVEVQAESLAISRTKKVAGLAVAMRLAGGRVWVLGRDPDCLVPLDFATWERGPVISLPHAGSDFDIAPDGNSAVVSYWAQSRCGLVDLRRGTVSGEIGLASESGIVRFRPDGKQILVGSTPGRTITIADGATGRVIVVLPLPFGPKQFCFKEDDKGGQMFVTGPGMDAVGIVYPYQGELAETVLAGREPNAMAVNSSLLFVTNPTAGDVTVMAIAERQIVAKIESGAGPCAVALADEYVLILNGKSGDMAVVRLSKLTDLRYKRAPLFTLIAVGDDPVGAAVCRL